jgi:hypothetical protein
MIMRILDTATKAYKAKHPEFYDEDTPDGFAWVSVQNLTPKYTMKEFNEVPSLDEWQQSPLKTQIMVYDVLSRLEDYTLTDQQIAGLWTIIDGSNPVFTI